MIFGYLKTTNWYSYFHCSWGYWFVVFPLAGLSAAFIFYTKKFFGIKLYFLSK